MIPPIASWYKRKYTLSVGYFAASVIGCFLFCAIFIPIIIGIEITNSKYEERHKIFMKEYKSSWNVFGRKSKNEHLHDAICPQLNEAGHNYKDCKIWNKKC